MKIHSNLLKSSLLAFGVAAIALLYQNFAPSSDSQFPNEGRAQSRIILPMVAASADAQLTASETPAPVACEPNEKRVVYLNLPNVDIGEHLVGTIEDTLHQQVMSVNIMAGRDFEIGNCANLGFSVPTHLKVCFTEAPGMYISFKVTNDSGQIAINETFPSHSYCEDQTTWFSNVLRPAGLN